MEISPKDGLPIIAFATKQEFYDWLLANHTSTAGVWIRYYKKASGVPTINWEGAVEAALCFGWIDAVANKYDEVSYIHRFVPRRPRGTWSKKNCATVERLIAEGLMQPAGQAEVDRAKADGRWDAAYDSPKDMKMPQDFLDALELLPTAKATFETLKKTSTYAIAFSLHTAKRPETRERRKQKFLDMLNQGIKLY